MKDHTDLIARQLEAAEQTIDDLRATVKEQHEQLSGYAAEYMEAIERLYGDDCPPQGGTLTQAVDRGEQTIAQLMQDTEKTTRDAIDRMAEARAVGQQEGKAEAEADLASLRATLARVREYVQHKDGCDAWPQFVGHFQQATKVGPCSCGLDAALRGE